MISARLCGSANLSGRSGRTVRKIGDRVGRKGPFPIIDPEQIGVEFDGRCDCISFVCVRVPQGSFVPKNLGHTHFHPSWWTRDRV